MKPHTKIFTVFSSLLGIVLFSFLLSITAYAAIEEDERREISEAEINLRTLKAGIKQVYIQSFTGQRVQDVKKIFLDTISEEPEYTVVELLPDKMEHLGVLRVKVLDYNFWEKEEFTGIHHNSTLLGLSSDSTIDTLLRRNVLVTVELSFFDALTGTVLLQGVFAQPFQQIYIEESEKKVRPEETLEMLRATKLLIFKILDRMTGKPTSKKLYLENGIGFEWYDSWFVQSKSRRIQKGNRLAEAGKLDQAILMWNIVLYEKEPEEPIDIYISNRVSAFYNLGVIYQQKNDWWTAASMFSKANRIDQQLKYSQAWGDNIYYWLQDQNKTTKKLKSLAKKMDAATGVDQPITEPPLPQIRRLEINQNFLLKPRMLWPFDNKLKAKVQDNNNKTSPLPSEKASGLRPLELQPLDNSSIQSR